MLQGIASHVKSWNDTQRKKNLPKKISLVNSCLTNTVFSRSHLWLSWMHFLSFFLIYMSSFAQSTLPSVLFLFRFSHLSKRVDEKILLFRTWHFRVKRKFVFFSLCEMNHSTANSFNTSFYCSQLSLCACGHAHVLAQTKPFYIQSNSKDAEKAPIFFVVVVVLLHQQQQQQQPQETFSSSKPACSACRELSVAVRLTLRYLKWIMCLLYICKKLRIFGRQHSNDDIQQYSSVFGMSFFSLACSFQCNFMSCLVRCNPNALITRTKDSNATCFFSYSFVVFIVRLVFLCLDENFLCAHGFYVQIVIDTVQHEKLCIAYFSCKKKNTAHTFRCVSARDKLSGQFEADVFSCWHKEQDDATTTTTMTFSHTFLSNA